MLALHRRRSGRLACRPIHAREPVRIQVACERPCPPESALHWVCAAAATLFWFHCKPSLCVPGDQAGGGEPPLPVDAVAPPPPPPVAAAADAADGAVEADDGEAEEGGDAEEAANQGQQRITTPRSLTVPGLGTMTLHVVNMPDRVHAGNRMTSWLLQSQLESALYASPQGQSTGALYRLLSRCSLLGVLLAVDKAAVSAGRVTQPEYEELMECLATPQARKVRSRPPRQSCAHQLTCTCPPHTHR